VISLVVARTSELHRRAQGAHRAALDAPSPELAALREARDARRRQFARAKERHDEVFSTVHRQFRVEEVSAEMRRFER